MRPDWFSRDKGSLKINNPMSFPFFFFVSGRTLVRHFVLLNLEDEWSDERE